MHMGLHRISIKMQFSLNYTIFPIIFFSVIAFYVIKINYICSIRLWIKLTTPLKYYRNYVWV